MAFTKITAAGIGSTETVTIDGLSVINDGSIGGNLSVGGTLTYEDVTNIDSVGLITARAGVVVGSGITLSKDGDIFATGVTTSTTFVGDLTGAATKVTLADESSDTSCNVLFATGATGNLAPKTGTNLTFNSNTGALTATSFSGDGAGLSNVGVDTGVVFTDKLSLGDSEYINVGLGSDLTLVHDGTNSIITNNTGDLNVVTAANQRFNTTGDFVVNVKGGNEDGLKVKTDGACELYYDNALKFSTTSSGWKCNDSVKGVFGTGDDLEIYSGGTGGKIHVNNGVLELEGDSVQIWNAAANEAMGKFTANGAVELYADNVKKISTNSTYGTILSNTTDDANETNVLTLTRRGYEASGYGVNLKVKGGSASSQNGLVMQVSQGSGGYSDKFRFDNDGLKFGSDTAAANGLSDYEEGTSNCAFQGAEGGNTSLTNAIKYTKIGDWVFICFTKNNFSNGGVGGTLELSMPFTSSNDDASAEWYGSDTYYYPTNKWDTYTDFTGLTPYIAANSTSCKFRVKIKDGDRQTIVSAGNNNQISGATGLYLRFALAYRCA